MAHKIHECEAFTDKAGKFQQKYWDRQFPGPGVAVDATAKVCPYCEKPTDAMDLCNDAQEAYLEGDR